MSHVLIFTDHPELYSSKRLLEEAQLLGHRASFLNPYEEAIELGGKGQKQKTDLILHRTTGIRHQDFDLALSYSYNAKVTNSLESFRLLRGKDRQALFFEREGFPFIPTYFFRGRPTHERLEKIKAFFKDYGDEKYILKTSRGNQGIGINLIRGLDSLHSLLETFWAIQDQDFLIQPFISIDEEYRLFSIAGKIEGALHRRPGEGEFRSNSMRGIGSLVEEKKLPEKIHELVWNLAKKSGAHYAGIDLLKTKDQYLLIEYNLVPGFHQMEELTKKNIAKLILSSGV